jgi:hypothetical protein
LGFILSLSTPVSLRARLPQLTTLTLTYSRSVTVTLTLILSNVALGNPGTVLVQIPSAFASDVGQSRSSAQFTTVTLIYSGSVASTATLALLLSGQLGTVVVFNPTAFVSPSSAAVLASHSPSAGASQIRGLRCILAQCQSR